MEKLNYIYFVPLSEMNIDDIVLESVEKKVSFQTF